MGGMFMPAGPIAAAESHLIITMVLLMLIIVVPMFIALFVVARKYRVRAGDTRAGKNKKKNGNDLDEPKYEPERASRSAWSQLILWAIPAALIAVLGTLNWQSAHALDPYAPIAPTAAAIAAGNGQPLNVEVIALPWKWLFIYPAQNIATVNFLEFPVGTPVHFSLTADGPISSFWIPRLGSQIYAMAAMQTQLNLLASSIGEFTGRDTEINGDGYAGMTFEADSVSPNDFAAWVAEMQGTSAATIGASTYPTLTMDTYDTLAAPSENNPPAYYSSVAPGLFDNVIMKYMMPEGGAETVTSTMQTAGSSSEAMPGMQGMPGMEM